MHRTKFKGKPHGPYYLRDVKNPESRPAKWDASMIFRVMFLARLGLTEKEIAIAVNVHEHTIYYWKRTKPDLLAALEEGKAEYTERVEKGLLESAVGYSHPDVHIAVTKHGEVIKTPITKHYPPNVTAAIFYLKNRAANRWMDVHRIEGAVQHRHTLDLTNLSTEQLDALETIGITELSEHGSDSD
ncbi:MAG: hypothetical protein KJ556_21270 [Gammaproteobacteria bacterium]|nr:hypothetical protein [Gammaproteobacteria bacterium]